MIALLWLSVWLLIIEVACSRKIDELMQNSSVAHNVRFRDLPLVASLSPLKTGDYLMFWRLQKVGSSTILSILMSYGYRYHYVPRRRARANSFCLLIGQCARSHPLASTEEGKNIPITPRNNRKGSRNILLLDEIAQAVRFKISLTHDICNFNSQLIHDSLKCAFEHGFEPNNSFTGDVKEIFMVREPLSRMASIYYFWGELFKMEHIVRGGSRKSPDHRQLAAPTTSAIHPSRRRPVLGGAAWNRTIVGPLFTYHGQESTVPPHDIAMAYAMKFPMRRGFPGPSLSTSAFAGNASDALAYMAKNEKMITIVLERLDESLVVLRHFLGWSLADVVVTQPRKALSSHPKISQWPTEAVQVLQAKLVNAHEYEVYDLAKSLLRQRMDDLQRRGINVTAEVQLLKSIRQRVREVNSPSYLTPCPLIY